MNTDASTPSPDSSDTTAHARTHPTSGPVLDFHASAISGTEGALCDELRELGFSSVRLNRGGIPFRGEWRDGWRACLQSRIASRIQVLMRRFPATSPESLYKGVQAVDWTPYLTSTQTLSVGAVSRGSEALHHSGFVALKVKDAIVDQVRSRTGARPSVSGTDADVRVFVYVVGDKASVYLDLSGESLHKRGYRLGVGDAPLRETLAAALLRLSAWDRRTPLVDPMCGSGTIAIEAAMWALNKAPGLDRERFGFERWANFGAKQRAVLSTLKGELRAAITGQTPRIVAADRDEKVLDAAKANARQAGVRLAFRHQAVEDLQGTEGRHLVVTNPPYGVRMDVAPDFYRGVAAAFCRLHGWRVCLLAGTTEYARHMSPTPVRRDVLRNGDLDCEFLSYEIA
ncbi:MAG: THUMP domain-containing protein [Verrucomicrobia bacterium]|nr:THUMP domain-containing protein [Verrucomicrobiota bacterium]